MSVRRLEEKQSHLLQTQAALSKISVRTVIHVKTVAIAQEMLANLSTSAGVEKQWPQLSGLMRVALRAETGANVTVTALEGVSYSSGSFDSTALIIPQTTPTPGAGVKCNSYTSPNNYTLVEYPTDTPPGVKQVNAGEVVTLKCAPSTRFVGNGTNVPLCKNDGSYSQGRYCLPCDVGATLRNGRCVPCELGYYYDRKLLTCKMCPLDTYMDSVGQTACTACPINTGTSKRTGSRSVASCSCVAGYIRLGQASCQQCPMGKYSDVDGSLTCKTCAPFTNTSSVGSDRESLCLCNPGYYQRRGSCEECLQGTFKNELGSGPCQQCVERTWTNGNGSSSAQDCRCSGGYKVDTGASTYRCTACAPGKYKPTSTEDDCSECGWGTLSAAGQTACENCPHGKYAPVGSSSCIRCTSGQYVASPGSSCSSCSPGKFLESLGSACLLCAPGQEAKLAGSTHCATCSPGKYNADAGEVCKQCAAGKRSLLMYKSTQCADCAPGTYTGSPEEYVCGICEAGKYASVGQSTCLTCEKGLFSSRQSPACTKCAVGNFNPLTMQSSCYQCAFAKYMHFTGRSMCYSCPPHSNTSTLGADALEDCHCQGGE